MRVSKYISTHAPRTGSDIINGLMARGGAISTHAPRTGSDIACRRFPMQAVQFQPTLPARGATRMLNNQIARTFDFNPRSPHGERRAHSSAQQQGTGVFQPTLPARGATRVARKADVAVRISTHAPRTGSDDGRGGSRGGQGYFNPRSPHGERPHSFLLSASRRLFQPTLPARGATIHVTRWDMPILISTHAPRTGSDFQAVFLRRFSCISTHAPRTGSDRHRTGRWCRLT